MNIKLRIALIILVLIAIGHYISRGFGLYHGYWVTDIVLHTAAGVMFGLFWLWLSRDTKMEVLVGLLSVIGFAVFGSFLWELWELGGHKVLPPSLTVHYVPTLTDALGDITSGMAGGALAYLFSAKIK